MPDWQKYATGTDPNEISFQISFTNQYVNQASVPLWLDIQGGVPYYWAVMLDSTNFPAAGWRPYTSSNITANLGIVQGWHTVWVGLRGLPADAQQTWNAVRLDLDLTPPSLVVANATNVTVPMLQLQGYASEELASLSFDLSNANGSISNQPGFITGAIFDTNSFLYTNCAFKCFDLALASGANTVILHAADLAGNVTNGIFIFNLDYSSKPAPVIQLCWPQDGAQISGSSFTLRGGVDDPTVALSAQVTDSNGDTNVVLGVIERNGNFWVDNIPLASGNNYLALTATDINNHSTTANITVAQTSVAMTINPLTDNLNMPTVTVTGSINAAGYTVWVNGVMATQSGTAPSISWTAFNVPMNGAGSAVVQARAIPQTPADNYGNGTGGGGGGTTSSLSNPGNPSAPDAVDAEINQAKLPALICDNYHQSWKQQGETFYNPGNTLDYSWLYTQTINWSTANGGSSQSTSLTADFANGGALLAQENTNCKCQWDTNGNGTTQSELIYLGGLTNYTNISPPVSYTGPTTFSGLQGQSLGVETSADFYDSGAQSATTRYSLHTGGRSLPGIQSRWILSANAQRIVDPWYPTAWEDWDISLDLGPFFEALAATISPNQVFMMGQQEVSYGFVLPPGEESGQTDGAIYPLLPYGEVFEFAPQVPSVTYCAFTPTASNDPPQIYFGTNNVTDKNNAVIVGQQINLTCTNLPGTPALSNFSWSVPGTTESQFYVSPDPAHTNGYPIPLTSAMLTNTNSVSFFWVDGGTKSVTCCGVAGGVTNTATSTFTVVRPTNYVTTTTGSVIVGNYSIYGLYMLFGDRTHADTVGILFSNTLIIPSGFSNGNIQWVQLHTSSRSSITNTNSVSGVVPHYKETVGTVLDRRYPYPSDTTNTASDSPGVTLAFSTEIGASKNQASKMWLMFQPAGSTNWVPLTIVAWNCTGSATGFGPRATNWFLRGTNITASPCVDSGTEYPIWTDNDSNFDFVPPLP